MCSLDSLSSAFLASVIDILYNSVSTTHIHSWNLLDGNEENKIKRKGWQKLKEAHKKRALWNAIIQISKGIRHKIP
jgi:hypothetical protein